MSLATLLFGRATGGEIINNDNILTDPLNCPTIMDECRNGRGIRTFNEKVLPFFQAEDFRRVDMPFMFTPDYGRAYMMRKRNLIIETPTHDLLDGYIISWRNHFKGDWGIHVPYFYEKCLAGNELKRNF